MKKAKMRIVQVEYICPYCGEGNIPEADSGSHLHDVYSLKETGKCEDCGKESKLPKPKEPK